MKMKRFVAFGLAAIMTAAMSLSAFAAKTADSGKGGDAKITITLPADNESQDDAEITYTVYKVFDATNDGQSEAISYTIDSANGELTDAMKAAGFLKDDAGNVYHFSGTYAAETDEGAIKIKVGGEDKYIVPTPKNTELTADQIAAIKAYAKDKIGTFKAKPTTDGTLEITGLEYGYYYIDTTTGSAVTIDSTNPNGEVKDKNSIPDKPKKTIVTSDDFIGSLDQSGKNALAQVGTNVYFKVEIVKVKGATNYVFHDKMSKGLEYNGDVAVDPAGLTSSTTPAGEDTVTVTFDNDKLAELEDGTKITITYSAKVTSDALSTDPANNTATLGYGNSHTTTSDKVNVYNAKFTVTKSDGEGNPLAGAGFVIHDADGNYYLLKNGEVSWIESSDDATEYTSSATGEVQAFTGLKDGTYTLVEKTVPSGYNKAANLTFTIEGEDYTVTNLEKSATVVNNAGAELPSTGGMGTTIFYIVGAILVLGAGVVLVSRKRMANY